MSTYLAVVMPVCSCARTTGTCWNARPRKPSTHFFFLSQSTVIVWICWDASRQRFALMFCIARYKISILHTYCTYSTFKRSIPYERGKCRGISASFTERSWSWVMDINGRAFFYLFLVLPIIACSQVRYRTKRSVAKNALLPTTFVLYLK